MWQDGTPNKKKNRKTFKQSAPRLQVEGYRESKDNFEKNIEKVKKCKFPFFYHTNLFLLFLIFGKIYLNKSFQ